MSQLFSSPAMIRRAMVVLGSLFASFGVFLPVAQAVTITSTGSPGTTQSIPFTYGNAAYNDTITFPSRVFYRSPAYGGTQTVKIQYLEYAKTRSYNGWSLYDTSPMYTAYPASGQSVTAPSWTHSVTPAYWWHTMVMVKWFNSSTGQTLGSRIYDYSSPTDYWVTSAGGFTGLKGWDQLSDGPWAYMYLF